MTTPTPPQGKRLGAIDHRSVRVGDYLHVSAAEGWRRVVRIVPAAREGALWFAEARFAPDHLSDHDNLFLVDGARAETIRPGA